MDCTVDGVLAALRAVTDTVVAHRDELVGLDRAIGDGDHGENLTRGFTSVLAKFADADQPGTPGQVFKLVATTLISTVGGAAGPLFGTAFLRAATAVGEASSLDGELVAAALRAAVDGVVARGKAAEGDKTLVDALAPAARAAETAATEPNATPAAVLAAAAQAAEDGAEATVPLVARKGRASYLGERSAGHLDPGARSTALILRALATSASTAAQGPAGAR
ncbi:dihydroxyacetone kinase subunit DhaL [Goodfellowiella coeruleoviolacea]|uniref:Dihydroxyacetone kinase, C-terminal domain n=1 Tax=Goodfellowiella coeruleoviolacea TaxID=334858 RepID=A0AAE3GFX2_9PSEU|nr:dihydroxyacetone kinase subunit DhaL [Goodfellowiella coeruleoviolacea]MCP2166968.1 dihydroxyacetone kinase, C-terminal domain [Goodfellowiella coeruleoviolacea]